ncbi:uncharacterized protein PV09_06662 [Verruconis gallopava]|uniref:Thioredoxin domain-containing protein n=1 Tax=Verruconis gallopava TaxID=253628 RepID=A0A0D1YLU7_9PEZI|nr:uncharacterized protein PV09_06662 [Verruconis gallopava]KIW01807.1 hypothetical protein PV09_06662 [Verruconis gallopava]
MIIQVARATARSLLPDVAPAIRRQFATSKPALAKNRIYNPPRSEDEWSTLLLLSTSSRRPLITLWTTAGCSSCAVVLPMVKSLIEDEGVGEKEGGVGFAEVDVESVLLGGAAGLAMTYSINSIPTLMAFDKSEPQVETRVTNLKDLKSKDFLRSWIEKEASRQGHGGAGGKFWGLFG